ncbi:MAG: hypothetical protein ACLPKB_19010 [Xanthobacteraceae bacterium]
MYNHSLVSADRSTHVKIVVLSLALVGLIVVAAINAGLGNAQAAPTRISAKGAVIKASKLTVYASHGDVVIR